MEKIKSFTVDHFKLEPGIYESRRDQVGDHVIITYDLRITKPNFEPVLNTAEIHTIEHLGATFLRNHPVYKDRIIYFGPMGCRTGFYLLLNGALLQDIVFALVYAMFAFIADFEGVVPGANETDCGNGLDHNLPMAKWAARKYMGSLATMKERRFEY